MRATLFPHGIDRSMLIGSDSLNLVPFLKLFNGSFNDVLKSEGRQGLQQKLKLYFNDWQSQARLLPLGRCSRK